MLHNRPKWKNQVTLRSKLIAWIYHRECLTSSLVYLLTASIIPVIQVASSLESDPPITLCFIALGLIVLFSIHYFTHRTAVYWRRLYDTGVVFHQPCFKVWSQTPLCHRTTEQSTLTDLHWLYSTACITKSFCIYALNGYFSTPFFRLGVTHHSIPLVLLFLVVIHSPQAPNTPILFQATDESRHFSVVSLQVYSDFSFDSPSQYDVGI